MLLASMILKAKGNEVLKIDQESTVVEALQIMAEKNIGALLVTENKRPVGIFSERDFVREVARDQCLMLSQPVKTYMTRELYCVSPSSSIDECMAIMTNKHVRHLPVWDGKTLVGILSIGDVVKNLIEDKNLLIDNLERFIFG